MNNLLYFITRNNKIAIGLIFVLILLLIFSSVVIVQPGESGVLTILGNAKKEPLLEGIHLRPPFVSNVAIYDTKVQKYEVKAASSTQDLQELNGVFAINFQLDGNKVVEIKRTQGDLENVLAKVIAPQTQEAFKIAAAKRTAEESVSKRQELKADFDQVLKERLAKYHILVLDVSVVDIDFSEQFSKAVEEKQIAEQEAQQAVYVAQKAEQEAKAEINRAKGKAEAQRLLAETLKAQGGQLVLQKEAIAAWKAGGSQVPHVLNISGDNGGFPFILNLDNKTTN